MWDVAGESVTLRVLLVVLPSLSFPKLTVKGTVSLGPSLLAMLASLRVRSKRTT